MTIKELRNKTGLSQSCFADKFDIPVRTVQQWEQGRCSPPEYLIKLIEKEIMQDDSMQKNDYISRYRLAPKKEWQICISKPFMNCARIHPLQQAKVRALIDEIALNKDINKIIIFGSSVTNHCHIGSDVDIYIEASEDINPIISAHSFNIDFWNNYRVDKRLMNEIDETGVVVYEH